MNQVFFEALLSRCRRIDSLLCIGLDPKLPSGLERDALVRTVEDESRRIVEATLPFAACYKPNIAFYEAEGPAGLEALERVLSLIPAEVPVILDTKRCDIGSTAEAYARAIFGRFGAGATTLSPYMGRDAVDPFLAYPGKAVFMLCRTSNPSAGRLQELEIDREPLFLKVADECVSWSDRIGLVVAGNEPARLETIRARHPGVWLLAPGIGAQGGDAESAAACGADREGFGILPVVARGVSSADDPASAARAYLDAINRGRDRARKAARAAGRRETGTEAASGGVGSGTPAVGITGGAGTGEIRTSEPHEKPVNTAEERRALLTGLIRTGCFRVGEFILKSGKRSPFYVDLRRVISSPQLLALAGRAYASLVQGLEADRVAAIPVAALPFGTAVSLETGIPLIFPRLTLKDHGTGNLIEGAYVPGERAVLLDDLITTGKSKLEAIEVLRAQGLVVTDLVVLLERGTQGRRDMEREGIMLHAYADIEELLVLYEDDGLIGRAERDEMIRYAREE